MLNCVQHALLVNFINFLQTLTFLSMNGRRTGAIMQDLHTSAGTIGAFTAVAASSPFKAPTTASAISMATPSLTSQTQENIMTERLQFN